MFPHFKSFYNKALENKPFAILSIVLILLFVAMYIVETTSNRFETNDFRVFYSACENYINSKPVYGESFGLSTGYYKYSPTILLFFTPFLLLPFSFASTLYYFGNIVLLLFLFNRVIKISTEHLLLTRTKSILILLLLFLTFCGHFIRELHLGNTNILLLFLSFSLIETQAKQRYILAGLLFAFMIFTKPYFLILGLPFLLKKDYQSLMSTFVWSIFLFVMTILAMGLQKGIDMHIQWINSILAHSNYLTSNNTLTHSLNSFLKTQIPEIVGSIAYILISGVLFVFFNRQIKHFPDQKNKIFILYFFMLMGLFPNFFITDTEHFMFSFGLIGLLAFTIYEKKYSWQWIPYCILVPFYLGEMNLFLPKEMALQIKLFGGMGIANFIFIIWSFLLSLHTLRRNKRVLL